MAVGGRQDKSLSAFCLLLPYPSPADEVNDLDPVAFMDCGLLPIKAADDSLIQLNREAFGRKREMVDKFGKCN